MSYSATKAQSPSIIITNANGTPFGTVVPPNASDPTHVLYKGCVRRVFGIIRACHQAHKHYTLHFKRGHAPQYAHQTAVGLRGQARHVAVIVRSDHVQPVNVIVRPTGGRPRLRKHRSP